MRRLLLPTLASAALAAALLTFSGPAHSAPPAATWTGDTVHSFVLFKIKHLGTSWAYGRFDDFTVSLEAGDEGANLSSVNVVVKAESIDTGTAKRDQDLRGPDFFNVKQFETITFKSTAAKAVDADTTEVTGDLTIHGETKPVTVKVVRVGHGKGMKKEDLAGYETTFTIKRSDYGMKTMVGPVGDEVTLTIAVEAARK